MPASGVTMSSSGRGTSTNDDGAISTSAATVENDRAGAGEMSASGTELANDGAGACDISASGTGLAGGASPGGVRSSRASCGTSIVGRGSNRNDDDATVGAS